MKTLLLALLLSFGLSVAARAQIVKALSYNTTNGIVFSATNRLTMTNALRLPAGGGTNDLSLQMSTNLTGFYVSSTAGEPFVMTHNGAVALGAVTNTIVFYRPISFSSTIPRAETRTNLSLGASWLTNTNVTNFRSAIGLGTTNDPVFNSLSVSNASLTRTNLGLGATAQTQFNAVTNDQSITDTTNFVDVTNMSFLTEANARYVVTASISLSHQTNLSGSTALQFVVSNATTYGTWYTFSGSSTISINGGIASFSAPTNARSVHQTFYVVGGTNNGEVKLQMAQSSATNSITNTINAGSWIRADKLP